MNVIFRGIAICYLIDLGLRLVYCIFNIALFGITNLNNLSSSFNQTSQDCAISNDTCVVASIRCGRNRRDERVQIWCTTSACNITALCKFCSDCYGICRITTSIEIENCIVDKFMCWAIEISRLNYFNNICNCIFTQQHPTKNTLLCNEILRRVAFEFNRASVPNGTRR